MISVYSKPNCVFCERAKDYLEELGVPYTLIDVSKNDELRGWLKAQGHKTVPQIYNEGVLLPGGFDGLSKLGKEELT